MERVWYQDKEFWQATEHILFDEKRLAGTVREVEQILSLLKIPARSRILDLCCGAGRHSLELSRQGFVVIGVDNTVPFVEKAQAKALHENLPAEFFAADMREFVEMDSFDAAINMFSSFGYFDALHDNELVLKNLFQSLKPQGVLLLEMVGKEILAKNFRDRDWIEKDGTYLLEERKPVSNWSRVESRWIILQGGSQTEFVMRNWIFSASEMTQMLLAAGFTSVEIFGSLAATPYDYDAKRLVAVAHK